MTTTDLVKLCEPLVGRALPVLGMEDYLSIWWSRNVDWWRDAAAKLAVDLKATEDGYAGLVARLDQLAEENARLKALNESLA